MSHEGVSSSFLYVGEGVCFEGIRAQEWRRDVMSESTNTYIIPYSILYIIRLFCSAIVGLQCFKSGTAVETATLHHSEKVSYPKVQQRISDGWILDG